MEGAITRLLGSILVVMIGGFSALWYRLSRLEGRMAGIEGGLNHIESVLKERK
ncbi:MAG: hypothetical protein QMC90_04030 [Dehalococcoidales bacterium]|nr:hypothetical protein [Dehalococcoidales bacterium]